MDNLPLNGMCRMQHLTTQLIAEFMLILQFDSVASEHQSVLYLSRTKQKDK